MDAREVRGVMALLNALYSRSPHPEEDREKVKAWRLALEGYEFAEVKRAVLKRAGENRFYPDVAEILEYLPKRSPVPDAGYAAEAKEWYRQREEECRLAGIPTAAQARARKISFAEYCRMAEEAGL